MGGRYMITLLRELLAAIKEMNERMEQLFYEVTRIKEMQAINGMRIDVLQHRIVSHEAFIDEKSGCFGERFCEEVGTETSV